MIKAWNEKDLGDFITLQRGYDLPYRLRSQGDVPVITSTGITDTHAKAKELAPGVVTGRYGTIGEVFYIAEDYWPHNTTLFVKDFQGNDPLFASYLLRTIDFQSHSGKSGVPGVNRNDLHALRIKVPATKDEQQAIASILSDIDNLLASLDRLIAKKRDLKQATMQQLLTGKKRLPGFGANRDYKLTDIGLIPTGWKAAKVGDVCDFIVPGRNKPKLFNGIIPWITTPDIDEGKTVSVSRLGLCISREEAKSIGSKIVPSHAVIMSCAGELGIVATTQNEIVVNQQLHVFIPTECVNERFLLSALVHQKTQIVNNGTKTAVPYLNKDSCNSIVIPLPPLPEQKAIAQILSDMDTELTTLQTRRTKTQALKQAMMQQLLTGQTRLISPTATHA